MTCPHAIYSYMRISAYPAYSLHMSHYNWHGRLHACMEFAITKATCTASVQAFIWHASGAISPKTWASRTYLARQRGRRAKRSRRFHGWQGWALRVERTECYCGYCYVCCWLLADEECQNRLWVAGIELQATKAVCAESTQVE